MLDGPRYELPGFLRNRHSGRRPRVAAVVDQPVGRLQFLGTHLDGGRKAP